MRWFACCSIRYLCACARSSFAVAKKQAVGATRDDVEKLAAATAVVQGPAFRTFLWPKGRAVGNAGAAAGERYRAAVQAAGRGDEFAALLARLDDPRVDGAALEAASGESAVPGLMAEALQLRAAARIAMRGQVCRLR